MRNPLEIAILDHHFDLGPHLGVAAFEHVDDGKGEFALAQVEAHRLAERLLGRREVEQVVFHLEGETESQAVGGERLLFLPGRIAQDGADAHARGEQVGGLTPDDVDVLVFAHAEVGLALDLEDLALDHAQGHIGQEAQDAQIVLSEGHGHRLRVEEVADEHRCLVAPARVRTLPAAAGGRLVDDVVVKERRGVDVFDHRAEPDHAVARVREKARGEKEQSGADSLASGVAHVRGDIGDDLEVGQELVPEDHFDPHEILLDEAEDVVQSHPGSEARGF